ncbi:TetR/AcrR family transcriptional regulator [Actinocorallia longicatena]|uniref:TetR/AcrR family transcriptional regulator n=1 Tax=Actinocorallia longicatena TaxID=111803 RepID=A0ABP6QIC1_9ACTN
MSSHDRIVDAAEECFTRFGVAKTTVEDVAQAAGMSRATLYRNFAGGRDELILAVFLRDVERFLDSLADRLASLIGGPADGGTPGAEGLDGGEAVVDGIMAAVAFVQGEPRIAALLVPEAVGHTQAVVNQASQRVLDLCASRVEPYFDLAREAGLVRADLDVAGVVELLFRMIASLSLSPLDRPEAETRRFLRLHVVPALIPS